MQKTTSIQSKTVCHISFNHSALDDRIYWKELISLTEAGFEAFHICVGDENYESSTTEGITIIQVKRISSENIWINRAGYILTGSNQTIKAIFEKAKNLNAAIYHFHDIQINAIVRKLKNLPHRPKVIYDCHEAYHFLMSQSLTKSFFQKKLKKVFVWALKKWELENAKHCDFIIANFPYVKNYFEKNAPFVPSALIHNYSFLPAPPSIFENVHEKKYDFVYAGHLTENRRIEQLVKAISLVKKDLKKSKLLLIGPIEHKHYSDKLNRLIRRLNLESNVIIHDPVSFTEISNFYKQSKIGLCILPQTDVFNIAIPIKLFEYMSYGLPVIFSDYGPPTSIIEKSECGFLVDFNDIRSIANKMKLLLNDRNLYNRFSRNGIEAIKNEYNWQKEAPKLLAIYYSLLANKREILE